MNLFLLLSIPLFVIIFSRFMMPRADYSILWKSLLGGAFSGAILFSLFWIFRDGWLTSWDLLGLFMHHWIGEFLIFVIPMSLFFVLWAPKGKSDTEFLTSAFGWFAGLFILMGLRDFYVTMPGFDDFQLFLLPVIRIFLLVFIPALLLGFFHTGAMGGKILWGLAGVGVCALGSVLITARLLGLVFPVWALVLGLGVLLFFWSKRRYS